MYFTFILIFQNSHVPARAKYHTDGKCMMWGETYSAYDSTIIKPNVAIKQRKKG